MVSNCSPYSVVDIIKIYIVELSIFSAVLKPAANISVLLNLQKSCDIHFISQV